MIPVLHGVRFIWLIANTAFKNFFIIPVDLKLDHCVAVNGFIRYINTWSDCSTAIIGFCLGQVQGIFSFNTAAAHIIANSITNNFS